MLGPDGQPLQRRYYCSVDAKMLTNDDIVRGYERDDGAFIVVTDEELEALAPRKSRDIDLKRFVQRSEIPRSFSSARTSGAGRRVDKGVSPARGNDGAHRPRRHRNVRDARQGVPCGDLRGGGTLRAVTMRFADELRTPRDVGLPPVTKTSDAQRREIERAVAELDEGESSTPRRLHDEYTMKLLQLAEKKRAASRDVVEIEGTPPPEDEEDTADVIDIMSVLKRRMGAARRDARGALREALRVEPGERGARRQEQEGALRAGEGARPSRTKRDVPRGAHRGDTRGRLISRRASGAPIRTTPTDRACGGVSASAPRAFRSAAPCAPSVELVPRDRQRDRRAGACARRVRRRSRSLRGRCANSR